MAYQMRFLQSMPMGSWLQQTTYALAPLVLDKHWFSSPEGPKPRDLHHIRRALARGLSGFLTKPNQCDFHEGCDQGLRQAKENTDLGYGHENLLEGRVNRYLFRKDINPTDAFKRLTDSLLKEFPQASKNRKRILFVLETRVTPHLFENPECFHRDVCLHCYNQNMARDFVEKRPNNISSVKAEPL